MSANSEAGSKVTVNETGRRNKQVSDRDRKEMKKNAELERLEREENSDRNEESEEDDRISAGDNASSSITEEKNSSEKLVEAQSRNLYSE
jgi:hypothetical protein